MIIFIAVEESGDFNVAQGSFLSKIVGNTVNLLFPGLRRNDELTDEIGVGNTAGIGNGMIRFLLLPVSMTWEAIKTFIVTVGDDRGHDHGRKASLSAGVFLVTRLKSTVRAIRGLAGYAVTWNNVT